MQDGSSDRIDELTEEITEALAAMASESDPEIGFVVVNSGPFLVGFNANKTTCGTIVAFTEEVELTDPQIMLIGSLDLEPNENGAFVVEYEIEEDEEWEEETLREFVLRALALLVYVFQCPIETVTFEKLPPVADGDGDDDEDDE